MDAVERHAQRLIRKYGLVPPIDVEALIKERAQLTYIRLPVPGVSGLCLNMKDGPAKAHVLIDTQLNEGRKKFTLAHELGHLVLPWHVGSTVDIIDISPAEENDLGFEYYQIEIEANQFAAELLMPSDWITELVQSFGDLAELHRAVTQQAQVSLQAAAIRLTRFLEAGIIWVMVRDGLALSKGQTAGTRLGGIFERDVPFSADAYPYALEHYEWNQGNTTIHWWVLPTQISVQENDPREWREVLDNILIAYGYLEDEWPAIKLSINGVFGGTNGGLKSHSERDPTVIYSPETVAATCLRQYAASPWATLLESPDMHLYIIKRAKDVFRKPIKKQNSTL